MNNAPDAASLRSVTIVLWSVAAEPVILAGIARFLKKSGAIQPAAEPVITIVLIIFAIASLGLLYLSFAFASGKYDPKAAQSPLPAREGVTRLVGIRIASVALAAAPAILGFVLYLISGNDWVLLIFNGGALLAAGKHLLAFSEASE